VAERFLALAAAGPADARPRLERPPEQVEATCTRHGLTVHGYWVIVPGAQEPSRAWPAAHYSRLARELNEMAPAPVVLLGSADEADLAEHIAAQCPEVVWRQLAGRTSVNQALDLLAGARAVLGNDSGPIHLAASLGRPQVSLFGPTDPTEFILTLACPDTKGIVHSVSGLLYQAGCNILDSQQFGDVLGDVATGLFFMRVHFEAPPQLADVATLDRLFGHVRQQFGMQATFHAMTERPRVLLMVSQHGHCLNDLLFRWKSGQLPVDIPAIVSNHPTYSALADSYGIPFHHLPLPAGAGRCHQARAGAAHRGTGRGRADRPGGAGALHADPQRRVLRAAEGPRDQHPPQLPARLQGRPPLPPGAPPRRQADRRHRTLRDGGSGRRPDHRTGRRAGRPSSSADDLTAVGRDVECVVLARAVRWHVERRVLMNGHKTVVFR
jgi:formyltetrahydrofolate deformylase